MDSLDKARSTQLKNIELRTGQNIDQLRDLINASGLTKHAEIRTMLMDKFGLGFGDASMLVHFAQNSDGQSAAEAYGSSMEDILEALYSGKNTPLRAIHEVVMKEITEMGEFKTTPKKGYISLRCKRQFAMIGPGTRGRLEIGLTLKGVEGNDRLLFQTNNLMCTHKVFCSTIDEVDNELVQWIELAYKASK